jgi:signal transduction histidine kinase
VAAAFLTLQWLVAVGFVLLGLLCLLDWLRHKGERRGYLGLAIGLLAVISLWGRINAATGNRFAAIATPITIFLFLGSGYALFLFRGTFIPLDRRTLTAVGGLALAAGLLYVLVAPPAGTVNLTPIESIALLALIAVWSGMVGEPVVRFWLAARGRPAVQRARLRLLSGGFAAIIFILVVAGAGGARLNSSTFVKFAVELIALGSIPVIYASFAPPRWLVRAWRETEEASFRRAVRDLLLFSPDRATLAGRALGWALRIVGADSGAILDGSEVLAIRGLEPDMARHLGAAAQGTSSGQVLGVRQDRRNAVVVPLPTEAGQGAIVAVSNSFMPILGSDEVLRLEEFAVNITAGLDRVRVTERLAQLEKTKTHFLNLASHEMRTPLSVIRGYLSLLDAGSLGPLTPEARKAVSILSGKALEMNLLIEQMLEAGRLEEGRVVLKPEVLDARKAAASAVDVVRPLMGTGHKLALESGDQPVTVRADRERLATILVNLIDNAIKYSPDGGTVRCLVQAPNGVAQISVEDQGVGITPEGMPILFTKFGRVPNPRTDHIGGTGLGLYLCRELARQQGGDISVVSTPGKGSVFTLTLPVVPIEKGKKDAPRSQAAVVESST